jgi:hypothetical protein
MNRISRPGRADLFWISLGIVPVIGIMFLALHYQRDTATTAAFTARRIERVERMRAALSSASEAEKSAVMATTDQESQTLADQSRATSAVVERERDELVKLLEAGGTRDERELLSQFSQDFAECQRIDNELLGLAVQNTNLKAYALAFGPAADALVGMDGALSMILKDSATSSRPEARQVMLLAAGAQSAAWRIQALLPSHISEESDQIMGELEAKMTNEDQSVRSALKELSALLGFKNSDLETARSCYSRFSELKTRILVLSHQNTNVRSVILSLNQKRKVVQMCQDALSALEQTIGAERQATSAPVNPRSGQTSDR